VEQAIERVGQYPASLQKDDWCGFGDGVAKEMKPKLAEFYQINFKLRANVKDRGGAAEMWRRCFPSAAKRASLKFGPPASNYRASLRQPSGGNLNYQCQGFFQPWVPQWPYAQMPPSQWCQQYPNSSSSPWSYQQGYPYPMGTQGQQPMYMQPAQAFVMQGGPASAKMGGASDSHAGANDLIDSDDSSSDSSSKDKPSSGKPPPQTHTAAPAATDASTGGAADSRAADKGQPDPDRSSSDDSSPTNSPPLEPKASVAKGGYVRSRSPPPRVDCPRSVSAPPRIILTPGPTDDRRPSLSPSSPRVRGPSPAPEIPIETTQHSETKASDLWLLANIDNWNLQILAKAAVEHGWHFVQVKMPASMSLHHGVVMSQLTFCLDSGILERVVPVRFKPDIRLHAAVAEPLLQKWPTHTEPAHKQGLHNPNACLRAFGVDGEQTRKMETDAGIPNSDERFLRSSLKTFTFFGPEGAYGSMEVDTYRERMCYFRRAALTDNAFIEELTFAHLYCPHVAPNGLMLGRKDDVVEALVHDILIRCGTGSQVVVIAAASDGKPLLDFV